MANHSIVISCLFAQSDITYKSMYLGMLAEMSGRLKHVRHFMGLFFLPIRKGMREV